MTQQNPLPTPARQVLRLKAKALLRRTQVRKTLPTQEYLKELAQSYLTHPLHPVIVRLDATVDPPGYVVLDGHLRVEGVLLIDPEAEVECLAVDRDLDAAEVIALQVISALHSTTLTAYDQAQAVKDWLASSGGTAKELSERLHLSQSMITRLNSLWSCVQAVQDAAKAGKIGAAAWYSISQVSLEAQPGLLTLALDGMSTEKVAARSRKLRADKQASDRAKTVRIPLAGQVPGTVTVAAPFGDDCDLEGVETLLRAALRSVTEAMRRGLGPKAAQASWRDMAARPPATK